MEEKTMRQQVLDYCTKKIKKDKDKDKLTVKEQNFCDYYLQTGNATASAKKAGYSQKTSAVIGFELLRKPKIKKYIDEQREKLHNENIANADEILRFWSEVLRCDDMPINFRLKASEYLGKGLNLFDGNLGKQDGKTALQQVVDALNGYVKRECQGENDNDN